MLTRYEVAVTRDGKAPLLVGYTPRVSRSGLTDVARSEGSTIIALVGITDDDSVSWVRVDGRWAMLFTRPNGSQACAVYFTGRTQVEARQSPLRDLPALAVSA